jgi:hypothetical protein
LSRLKPLEKPQLAAECFQFIFANAKACLASEDYLQNATVEILLQIYGRDDLDLDEIFIFRAILQWIETKPQDRKPKADKLLELVRLTLISPNDLVAEVQPCKLIPLEKIYNALASIIQKKSEVTPRKGSQIPKLSSDKTIYSVPGFSLFPTETKYY